MTNYNLPGLMFRNTDQFELALHREKLQMKVLRDSHEF